MTEHRSERHSWLPILGVSIPLILIFLSVLSVPLAAAQSLGLSPGQTTSWIMALYGLNSLLALAISLQQRQPLLLTGNLFALAFIASLGEQISYPELIGGFVIAGAGVLILSALKLRTQLAKWIPAPVVFGLLAGAVVPFVSNLFTSLGERPLIVGGTFVAYLLGRRFLAPRVPGILAALVAGVALTVLSGNLGSIPASIPAPVPLITWPQFSLQGAITVAPVLIVLIAVQSNLPSTIYLNSMGFEPPSRQIDIMSGLGTMAGSLLGPMATSLSLPATALLGGEQAGARRQRYRSILILTAAGLAIAALAAVAADLPKVIPPQLLLALAGLAMLDVLVHAIREIAQGPLALGPVIAFALALSEIALFGFGSFFWALLIGTAVAHLLERDGLRALHAESHPPAT